MTVWVVKALNKDVLHISCCISTGKRDSVTPSQTALHGDRQLTAVWYKGFKNGVAVGEGRVCEQSGLRQSHLVDGGHGEEGADI